MAQKVLTNPSNYLAIADAIRAKGVEGSWKPSEMATAIASIQSGGSDVGSGGMILGRPDFENMYELLRGDLPPAIDAKKIYDKYLGDERDLFNRSGTSMYYVYSGVIDKESIGSIYHFAYGTTLLGYYDQDGEFVLEYNTGYQNTTTSIASSNFTWHEYNGHQYILWIFVGAEKNFAPYISSTTYSYPVNIYDLDIYYNAEMTYSSSYFKRLEAVFPKLRFLRMIKGPEGYYRRNIDSDNNALYYKSTGATLQVVRDLQIEVYSTNNSYFLTANTLLGAKCLTSPDRDTSAVTLYGKACFPTCPYQENSGYIRMRSTTDLPLPSTVVAGGYYILKVQDTPFTSAINMTGDYIMELHLADDVTSTSTSGFINNIVMVETLINLATTLPQYDSTRFTSNVISVQTHTPVSLYQKELQPLFDKGWTVSGGR